MVKQTKFSAPPKKTPNAKGTTKVPKRQGKPTNNQPTMWASRRTTNG